MPIGVCGDSDRHFLCFIIFLTKFKKNQKTLHIIKKYFNFAIKFVIILNKKELELTNLNRFGGMKKIFVLFTLCIAMSTSAFAQYDQDEQEEVDVYVSIGCNKDNHYHMSRYCKETMFCRHEHDKAAVKKCSNECVHMGHLGATTLDRAESTGKTPCPTCCCKMVKKGGKNKKDKKKNKS